MEDRLYKFAVLVECGSYTKAAIDLHISQPALTNAIQKLERELKVELIVPGSRPLQTTPAGQTAYSSAKELAVQVINLKEQLAEQAGQQVSARVGIIDSLADTLIADEQAFRTLQAATRLNLTVHNSRQLLQALEHDELDIAFIVKQAGATSALIKQTALGNEALVLVVHSRLEPIYKNAMERGIIPGFLSYNKGSTTQGIIHATLISDGLEPLASLHSTSPGLLLALALQGQGAAVLPHRMVAPHIATGSLVRLQHTTPLTRPVISIVRRGRQLTAPLHALQAAIHDLLLDT